MEGAEGAEGVEVGAGLRECGEGGRGTHRARGEMLGAFCQSGLRNATNATENELCRGGQEGEWVGASKLADLR